MAFQIPVWNLLWKFLKGKLSAIVLGFITFIIGRVNEQGIMENPRAPIKEHPFRFYVKIEA